MQSSSNVCCACGLNTWLEEARTVEYPGAFHDWLCVPPAAIVAHVRKKEEAHLLFSIARWGS